MSDDAVVPADPTPNPAPIRRPDLRLLLFFVITFLVLLIVFRTVLFPFLMAIFVAYLVEPVVARLVKSRVFGITWTRGPAIVLIYVLVVGGLLLGAWKGLTALATLVRTNAQELATAAKEEVPRARFLFSAPSHSVDLEIPAGTRVQHVSGYAQPGGIWETRFDAVIEVGEESVAVLLRRPADAPSGSDPPLPQFDDVLEVLPRSDGASLQAGIQARAGAPAKGLEVLAEDRLVTPLTANLRKAGMDIQPDGLRAFIAHKAEALSEDLPEKLGKGALTFAGKIALSIYEFFLILMLTAFIVTDRKNIAAFFASLPPPRYQASYLKLMSYIDDGLAGVIRGQLVICLVNGVLTWLGLVLLGVKGAVMLSVIAAVLSLIPIFGTIVSSIPIVLIAATDGIDKGVLALAWIVFIHMVEANLLNPMIMGSHAQMHPVIIVFALLAGEHSFGVWGALLAVPTMSILQACFRFYRHEIEGIPKKPVEPHGAWFREKLGGLWRKLFPKKDAATPPSTGAA